MSFTIPFYVIQLTPPTKCCISESVGLLAIPRARDPTPGSKNGGVLNRLRRTVPDPSRCMCMCSCLSSTSSPAPGSDLESHHRDAIRAIRMWHDTPSSSSSYRARFVAGGAYRNERSRARVIYLDPLSHSTGPLIWSLGRTRAR